MKNSILDHSSFYQVDLSRSSMENCQIQEVSLQEANCQGNKILTCNLFNAQFDRTDLRNADLSGSFHFMIDPEMNSIDGTQFSKGQLIGLLEKYNIKLSD